MKQSNNWTGNRLQISQCPIYWLFQLTLLPVSAVGMPDQRCSSEIVGLFSERVLLFVFHARTATHQISFRVTLQPRIIAMPTLLFTLGFCDASSSRSGFSRGFNIRLGNRLLIDRRIVLRRCFKGWCWDITFILFLSTRFYRFTRVRT